MVAFKLAQKKVLVAGLEEVYGTDIVTSGGASVHGVLASNFTMAPMAATVAKRQRAYATFGSDPSEITQKYRTIGFDIEAVGAGELGVAPSFDSLLQACGTLEQITDVTNAIYTPLTPNTAPGGPSASMHFFWENLEHKLLGSRGNFKLKCAGGTLPMWQFSMTGLYSPVTDAAPPDVHADLEAFIDAQEVNLANTTFSLFGQNVTMESLEIDFGSKVIFRDRPNAAYVAITDRAMTGTVSFDAPTIATYDWLAAAANKTTGALALQQGTVGGKELVVAAPVVRILNPTYQDTNGILTLQAGLEFCRTAGDDEISFTFQ
jgi:hypothetical protein